MVAERRALREARGAARVLDVDRVVELGRGLALGAARPALTRSPPAMNSSQSRPMNTTCSSPARSPRTSSTICDVVGGLERRRGDQHPAAGLAQHVLELGRPVGRVDVDQDDPGLGRRVLDERPLGAVRAPDADAVAGLDPGGDERARARGRRPRRTARTCSGGPGGRRRAPRGRRSARSCGRGCRRSCRPAAAWSTSRMRTTAPWSPPRSLPRGSLPGLLRRWKRALSSGIVSSGVDAPCPRAGTARACGRSAAPAVSPGA